MTGPALLGVGFFLVFSLVLGVRLLWLGRRSRGLPELLMGTAFLCSGFLGFGLQVAAQIPDLLEPGAARACFAAGRSLVCVGVACQAAFTWRVFRRDRTWAATLCAAIAAALLGVLAGCVAAGEVGNPHYSGTWFWLQAAIQVGATAWGAVESLAYWLQMRRRLRLGLADPIVTNRFLAWGVAIGAGVLALCCEALIHGLGPERLWGVLLPAAAGMGGVSVLGYWLTFFPPDWYRRWLLARAGADAAA